MDLSDIAKGLNIHKTDVKNIAKNYAEFQQLYAAAIRKITTKLQILDEEFKSKFDYNPIHHIESRLKNIQSIREKAERKNIGIDIDQIKCNIFDIAGVRVICNYIEDIYKMAEFLLSHDDITLIRVRDYIKKPKPNGYRSLHLIIKTTVYLAQGKIEVPVEIQIRTIAMDFWASLEHQLRYKAETTATAELKQELKLCAESIHDVDVQMQTIKKRISASETSESSFEYMDGVQEEL